MAHRYIALPLNTNVKFWNLRWFYMPRAAGQNVRYDVDQIPVSNQEMEQVRELLALIDERVLDGVVVGWNFLTRRVQPGKERSHPSYEYRGESDGTHEVPEKLTKEQVMRRLCDLFSMKDRVNIADPQKSFTIGNLPPPVRVVTVLAAFLF
jgi:hypothetical protein